MSASDDLQRLGWEAFQNKLPELLETDPEKWVAFHGEAQVAISDTKDGLYQVLNDAETPLDEVVVRRVQLLSRPPR